MFFSMCTVALAGAFAYRLSLTYFDSQHFPPSLSDAACLLGLFVLMLKQADKLARTRRARRLVLAIQAGKYISVASFIFYVWCVHGIDNGVFLIVLAGYATLEAFRTTGLLLKLRRVPPERSGLG